MTTPTTGRAAALTSLALSLTLAAGQLRRSRSPPPQPAASTTAVPFYSDRQAGIVTPAQDRLHFAAFDVTAGTKTGDLADLLRVWTRAAARMCNGDPAMPGGQGELAPPLDTRSEEHTSELQSRPHLVCRL